MPARAISDGLFEIADDGTITLVGGYSPSSGRYHFPLLDLCPYTGATDIAASRAVDRRQPVGVDRGDRRAARLRRSGSVRLRRGRADRERLRVITR